MNENPPPPAEAPVEAPAPAPPPAAHLVTQGVVRSERELQLERDLEAARKETASEREARRKAEFDAAERERIAQELIAQTKARPADAPKPPKARRFGPIPILTSGEE